MMRYLVLLVLVGCGSVSNNKTPDAKQVDGAIDGKPPRCNPNAPFGTPQPVDALNTTGVERAAQLSPDELTIYFASDRGGSGSLGMTDIYVATRLSSAASFGTPAVLAGVNSSGLDDRPSITADGLFLYMERFSTQTGYDLYVAQRASAMLDFGAPVPIMSLMAAGTVADGNPYILPNNSTIYFATDRNGNQDIYRATRTIGGTFETAMPAGIPTAYNEAFVAVTPDELTIFFSSDAPGGLGGYDIYMAKRVTTADGWGPAQLQDTLNSTANENPTWVSADGGDIYLERTVPGRNIDLYFATRGQ
jgi:Tol biopolymer transport system component